MADIARDSEVVELDGPPNFAIGERVASRKVVRNDGTYAGRAIGEVLARRGDIGYVSSIGTFLQQFYIYAVDFAARGTVVGMKGREIVSLDRLDPELEQHLGSAALERLARLVPGDTGATVDGLLAATGARGRVLRVGRHEESGLSVYLVVFDGCLLGCLDDDLDISEIPGVL